MARVALCLGVVALVVLADSVSAGPPFGSGSFSQASAQSGSYRGVPPRAPVQLARPGLGNQGFGNQGFGNRGFGNQRPGLIQGRNPTGGIAISSSKSISIGGGPAAASSSSKSGK
ncbi:uncharacterized protein LOC113230518 [Hyposmocoma kahamanoa]|uniref:uncharacterized protein LOC113230518 n=1 Tax=Hyposmocoma kahamanoa TaxID=1477025 RepID=UPI000E6D8D17|nr:uncharacterized protein LOC113230518 [Hyposmocoma kahamanoa]